MSKRSRKLMVVTAPSRSALGELIHETVRSAIERAVEEELEAALGAAPWERSEERHGYRNGSRDRTLAGPTGNVRLEVPRGRLSKGGREEEWSSKLLPRYQRRMPELNEAVIATYLSGGNTRRVRAAMRPLLKDAPLSKSAVSRVVATLQEALEAWRKMPLGDLDVAYLYLDAIALKVRSAGKVVSAPVLAAVAVLSDGEKRLLALEMCGSESYEAWKGFVAELVERGLRPPVLAIVDGNAGLRRALGEVWPKVPVQRCCVHKLRNLERKAPQHAREEIADDFHRIVYADDLAAARTAYQDFLLKWKKQCPGVARSLEEGGEELLTFFTFPKEQWKTIRTTNVIERLNGEFRRRVKTQSSLPTEDAAVALLFALVASGQIRLRKLDGFEKIAAVLSQKMRKAA